MARRSTCLAAINIGLLAAGSFCAWFASGSAVLHNPALFGVALTEYVRNGTAALPKIELSNLTVSNYILNVPLGEVGNSAPRDGPKPGDAMIAVSLPSYLEFLLQHILKATPFDGKFAINLIPQEDRINLYFLDTDLRGLVQNFSETSCVYVGHYNGIICRNGYFEEFARKFDSLQVMYDVSFTAVKSRQRYAQNSRSTLSTARELLKRSLLAWIIGHELGHAVKHRHIVEREWQQLHFNLAYSKEEAEADEFFAKALAADAALLGVSGLSIMTGEFIEQEFRESYLSNVEGADRNLVATRFFPTLATTVVYVSPFSMPRLVRLLELRQAIAKEGIFVDQSGYYEIVAENIREIDRFRQFEPRTFAVVLSATVSLIGALWLFLPLRRKAK